MTWFVNDKTTTRGLAGRATTPVLHYQMSDSHWHYDVAVLVLFAFGGAHLSGGLGIFEFEFHVSAAGGLEKIQQILRIEADGDRVAVVIDFERVFGLAGFGGGSGEFQLAFFQPHFYGSRALVGELGHARYGYGEFLPMDSDALVVVFRQYGFEVGELAGELARSEEPRADAEK